MASLRVKEILCLLYSGLLFLSGVLLIVLASVLTYKLLTNFKFVPSNCLGPFIVIFLLGLVHMFVTWLGIRGPPREHDFHIILFIVISIVLIIIHISVGIWAIVLRDEVDVETVQSMTDSFAKGSNLKDWTSVEDKFHCCGLNGIQDYVNLKTHCAGVYSSGCKKPLTAFIKSLLIDAAIISFCVCLLHVLGAVAFVYYYKGLRRERTVRNERRSAIQQRVASHDSGNNGQQMAPPSLVISASAPAPVSAPLPPSTPQTPPVTTA